jgi:SOS-response transcriptional repressor LexA
MSIPLVDIRRMRLGQLLDGHTQESFSKRVGKSQAQVSHWMTGFKNIGSGVARDIEIALELPQGWLDQVDDPKSNEVREPEAIYSAKRLLPVVSWVKAGNWGETIDLHEPGVSDRYETPRFPCTKSAFWLEVTSDSMTPNFPSGTLILCEPELEPNFGDFCVVRDSHKNTAVFKKYSGDAFNPLLASLNEKYAAVPWQESFVIVGRVTQFKLEGRL